MVNAKKLLSFIPAFIYYAAGFYLSSKNWHLKTAFRDFDKIFHAVEFCGFGILLAMGFFKTLRASTVVRAAVTCAFGFVFAALDEFHQYFVPGRRSDVRDFLADAVGIVLGIMIVLFFVHKTRQKKSLRPSPYKNSPDAGRN